MLSLIEDYALIGDCQTAALVSRDGSVDCLCVPRFDSPACFAALVGMPEHGCWRITPEAPVRDVRRRYRDGTLILETDFRIDGGLVRLIDFMPPRTTVPDLVRVVECLEGEVPMRLDFAIGFDYGSVVPWVRRDDAGIRAVAGPDTVCVRTPVPLRGEGMRTVTVSEGERVPFTMTWCPTHGAVPAANNPEYALAETEDWWREWSGHCMYEGEYREQMLRSLVTLKALTYAPTGGIVAAPTASLPERIGGVRSWDYRYYWVQDATFTLYALIGGGYTEEAKAWRRWLVDAVAGTSSQMQIMHGLAGERRLTELELEWLPLTKTRPRSGSATRHTGSISSTFTMS